MTHVMRPTIGNTVARNKFNATPTTYVAMYDDGSYGPERETREQAERDYKIARLAAKREKDEEAMRDALAAFDARQDAAWTHAIAAMLLPEVRAYRDALRKAFAAGKQGSLETLVVWEQAHTIARQLNYKYGPSVYARMDNIAYRYC